jgi:hypothetical protein
VGDPDAPRLDQGQLLRTLSDHHVEFVLVGGAGANAHGAERLTTDLDIVARWTTENLTRMARALTDLSARLKVPGLEPIEAPLDARMLARMELSTWRTSAGDFDVISQLPHGKRAYVDYDTLLGRAHQVTLYGVPVQVASLDDIITSKETVNRPPDRAALPELYHLRAKLTSDPTEASPVGEPVGESPRLPGLHEQNLLHQELYGPSGPRVIEGPAAPQV